MLGLFAFFYAVLPCIGVSAVHSGLRKTSMGDIHQAAIYPGGNGVFPDACASGVDLNKGDDEADGPAWKGLHKLVPIAIAAWVHFIWQSRSDVGEMVVYGLVVLLRWRFRWKWSGSRAMISFARLLLP